MNVGRIVVLLLAAACISTGVALGANIQQETILRPADALDDGGLVVSGQLVVLTGFVVAVGALLLAWSLCWSHWKRNLALALAFPVSWLLVILGQTAIYNFHEIETETQRFAVLSNTPLWSQDGSNPAVLLVIIGALVLLLMATAHILVPKRNVDPVREHRGRLLLAAPFLAIAGISPIPLLAQLPPSDPASTLYYVVWPLMSLAFMAFFILAMLQHHARAQGALLRHMSVVSAEQDRALRLTMFSITGFILLIGLVASFLDPIALASLEGGRTLSVSSRAFTQLTSLSVFMALPLLMQPFSASDSKSKPRHYFVIACLAAMAIAVAILSWFPGTSLVAWAAAAGLGALATLATKSTRWSILSMMLVAIVLWGIGNSVQASFDAKQDIRLSYEIGPGVLAFVRILSMIALGWSLTRAGKALGRQSTVLAPMVLGALIPIAVLIWLSLGAWILGGKQDMVGLGPSITSQTGAIFVSLHIIASLALTGGLIALHRIMRPQDWKAKQLAEGSE